MASHRGALLTGLFSTQHLLLLLLLAQQLPSSCLASSIRRPGYTTKSSRKPPSSKLKLPAHARPDPLVSASPLAVAAVCREGVVCLALHTSLAGEPLLLSDNDEGVEIEVETDDDQQTTPEPNSGETQRDTNSALRDLPRAYRGPFRIAPIDGYGTALLTAGWRTDCHALAERCRRLAANELSEYDGLDAWDVSHEDGNSGCDKEYVRSMAADAASWLARCALSSDARALSCVGLLASPGGYLYLIDPSGATHAVRAMALGWGSERINRRLLRMDLAKLSSKQAMEKLMEVVAQEGGLLLNSEDENDDSDGDGDDDDKDGRRGTQRIQLPPETRVERAVVDATTGSMRRLVGNPI